MYNFFQRLNLKFQVGWEYTNVQDWYGLKKFLFSYEGAFESVYDKKPCIWIRGWVKVLGFHIGAGLFYSQAKFGGDKGK
jgi:hypothetical protein